MQSDSGVHGKKTAAVPASAPAAHQFGRPEIPAAVSFNYSVAKVISIALVVLGHWFTGTLLWIPVTIGLFLFAFSSGYFTMKLYGERIDRKTFWRKKLERLGLRFWVILCFLTVIVALQGKTILHWHTLVHFAGLSGVLNWISVPNRSGLGAGLWFFTLLLIFYFAYPYLALLRRTPVVAAVVAGASFVAAVWLEETVKVGHELWLTGLGFILGVLYASYNVRISPLVLAAGAIVLSLALLVLNAIADFKTLNTALIALISVASALWLVHAELPRNALSRLIARLDKYLLEIFLMHTYLFVHVTGSAWPDLALSLALILITSTIVHKFADALSRRVFDRRATSVAAVHT